MNNPKVSVIVPIYKVEKYLVQCIDSIVNQTLQDIEIILVDEGDIDACRFIIDHYEQTDNRVKTIHEKNGGYGASVNKGLDIARGEYISIIESDDFIEPAMYEEMYEYAKKLDADVVKVPYYEYWDKTATEDEIVKPCCWQKLVNNIPQNKTFSIEEYPVLMSTHPSIWSALYKREYLKNKDIRCIEEKGAGYVDNHFRVQVYCQTDKLSFLNKSFNYYRLSNEDASTANYNLSTFIKRWADVHNLFDEKFPELWIQLASYCISEEWINTLYRLLDENYYINDNDIKLLAKNLSYYSNDLVKNSSLLTNKEKQKIIKVKNNYKRLNKYVRTNGNSGKITVLNVLGFNFFDVKKVKKLTWFVRLFKFLPILKIKRRNKCFYKIYLFGFIPIAEMRGV